MNECLLSFSREKTKLPQAGGGAQVCLPGEAGGDRPTTPLTCVAGTSGSPAPAGRRSGPRPMAGPWWVLLGAILLSQRDLVTGLGRSNSQKPAHPHSPGPLQEAWPLGSLDQDCDSCLAP